MHFEASVSRPSNLAVSSAERRPPVSERRPPSETERLRAQLQTACEGALEQRYAARRARDSREPARRDPPQDCAEAAQDLMASPEFQAGARTFNAALIESLKKAYADPQAPTSDETALASLHGLPGIDSIVRRVLLLGSLPRLVEIVNDWQRRSADGRDGTSEAPRDIDLALRQYAQNVGQAYVGTASREGLPGARLARAVVDELVKVDSVDRSIVNAVSKYVSAAAVERGQSAGPALSYEQRYLSPREGEEAGATFRLVAPLVQEIRGYLRAPMRLSDAERHALAKIARVQRIDLADLEASDAYAAGHERSERDEAAARKELEAFVTRDAERDAHRRYETQLNGRLHQLHRGFLAEQQAARSFAEDVSRYDASLAESIPGHRLVRDREIDDLKRQIDALLDEQRRVHDAYYDALPGSAAQKSARSRYRALDGEIAPLQARALRLQDERLRSSEAARGALAQAEKAEDRRQRLLDVTRGSLEASRSWGDRIDAARLPSVSARRALLSYWSAALRGADPRRFREAG